MCRSETFANTVVWTTQARCGDERRLEPSKADEASSTRPVFEPTHPARPPRREREFEALLYNSLKLIKYRIPLETTCYRTSIKREFMVCKYKPSVVSPLFLMNRSVYNAHYITNKLQWKVVSNTAYRYKHMPVYWIVLSPYSWPKSTVGYINVKGANKSFENAVSIFGAGGREVKIAPMRKLRADYIRVPKPLSYGLLSKNLKIKIGL
jgi:hypothetical protein